MAQGLNLALWVHLKEIMTRFDLKPQPQPLKWPAGLNKNTVWRRAGLVKWLPWRFTCVWLQFSPQDRNNPEMAGRCFSLLFWLIGMNDCEEKIEPCYWHHADKKEAAKIKVLKRNRRNIQTWLKSSADMYRHVFYFIFFNKTSVGGGLWPSAAGLPAVNDAGWGIRHQNEAFCGPCGERQCTHRASARLIWIHHQSTSCRTGSTGETDG